MHLVDPFASADDDAEAIGYARRNLAGSNARRRDDHASGQLTRIMERGVVEAADRQRVEPFPRSRADRPHDAARHHRLVGSEFDMGESALALGQRRDMNLRLRQFVLARHLREDGIVTRGRR